MKSKHWLIFLVTVVLLAGLLLSACAEPTPTTPTPTTPAPTTPTPTPTTPTTPAPTTPTPTQQYGGKMTLMEGSFSSVGPGWPAEIPLGPTERYVQACLETLVEQYIDGHYEPRLATDWEIAPDKSSITFTLRKGVKFHDGSDFNAQAVKFNYDALIAAKKFSTQYWESVDIIDDYTVRVNLNTWVNWVLSTFGFLGGDWIVSPTAFEKNGIEWMRQNMVGTGPFKQVGWEQDVRAVFERNDNYWQKGKPYLDELEILCVQDEVTRQAAMDAGEADAMVYSVNPAISSFEAKGLKAVIESTGVYCYCPDSKNPDSPLADQKVREAIEYAIDKKAIAETLSYGYCSPAYQMIPPDGSAYDPSITGRKYDPDKAKQLLAEAGYTTGLKINIITMTGRADTQIATAVQAQLAKVGVEANLEMKEWAAFQGNQVDGWSNGFLSLGVSARVNPLYNVGKAFSPAYTGYVSTLRSPKFIELYNQAGIVPESDAVKAAQAMIRQIYDEAMALPIWNNVAVYIVQPYVHDANFVGHANTPFWDVENVWLSKK